MRPFISFVTVLAFGLHALLGCCWHHGHAEELRTETPTTEDHAHNHHGHTHAHSPCQEAESAEQPTDDSHDDCHENHCWFLLASNVHFKPLFTVTWLEFTVVQTVSAQNLATCSTSSVFETNEFTPLPVRLHLWHQTFLN